MDFEAQSRAPYFEALADYVRSGVRSFHMPGHQQGLGAPAELVELLGLGALQADITQVLGMDDNHRADQQCGQAQRLAAQAYGAEHTYFLVNGSSCGNQSMLMTCLREDELVLIPRNAHRSTLTGVMLSGARAAYYENPFDEEMGVYHAATLEGVTAVLDQHPQARALFLTTPTYYGAAADVHQLTALAHARGLVVLVDEAWGPHLRFHPNLPPSAVEAGADLVVQSSHKLVSGMSQASMLHLRGDRVDRGRLESVLRMLQTTSPSCLLLASLDVARRQMALKGLPLLTQALELAERARAHLTRLGVRCYSHRPGVFGWDATRLVFSLAERGFSGYEAEKFLRYRHNLQMEMSDRINVVALVTLGHGSADIDRLIEAVEDLCRQTPQQPLRARQSRRQPRPESRLTLKQAFNARWESVSLEQAQDRICVDTICPYPPGIAWVVPGEVLTAGLIEALRVELAAGVTIQGAFDPQLETVRVVKE
jgi:arginine/lysine/ornithine decarboxylase